MTLDSRQSRVVRYDLDVCSVCDALARDAVTRIRCDYHPDALLRRIEVVSAAEVERLREALEEVALGDWVEDDPLKIRDLARRAL